MTRRYQPLMMPNSIIGRLRLLLATVFAVGTIVALGAAWIFSNTAATQAYDRLLISAATQISEAIGDEQGKLSVLPPVSAFETLAQSKGDRFFLAVRAPDGTLITGRDSLRPTPKSSRDAMPELDYIDDDGEAMRSVTIYRLIASPDASGWCSVVAAQSLGARYQLALHLMLRIGAIVIFVGALGFLASLEAVKRALRPFDRIGQALAARRAQDTGMLEVDSPRETQALVETINGAFHRLDERLNKLQNFTGVAAHQIRTPLAALGAQTELLLSDRSSSARRERVDRMRTHILKLSRLTNQLLGQAMVSYRSDRFQHQKIELVELVRHVLRDAIPESLDRDLAVEFETENIKVFVIGDAVTIREALANLVSNAVTHGAASVLRVRIGTAADRAIVYVADDGPGISPERWVTACQPFQIPRADGMGSGLGLSIVADVAKAHGGKLVLRETVDNMFEIALDLTLAEPLRAVA
jgi:two-component system, OmpR family, sensor histidine kinase TctE